MIQAAVAAVANCRWSLFGTEGYQSHVGHGMESHRIGPGLMLHAYSYSAVVSSEAATGEDTILMSAIGYKFIYSFEQAKVEQGMAMMAYFTDPDSENVGGCSRGESSQYQ